MRNVFLINDQLIERDCWQFLIERQGDLRVCGLADEWPGESEVSKRHLDVMMIKGSTGLVSVIDLKKRDCVVARVVIINDNDEIAALHVLRSPLAGLLTDRDNANSMLAALRLATPGEPYISPRVLAFLPKYMRPMLKGGYMRAQLSTREFQVFSLLGSGKTSTQIAKTLELNLKTTQAYVARIKEKLGFKTINDLIRNAVKHDCAING